MTIYVPFPLTPYERDYLFGLHRQATQIICYEDEVESQDREGIVRFLLSHKDPDVFVYVGSQAHLGAAILERLTCGWFALDRDGVMIVDHYAHDPKLLPSERIKRVSGFFHDPITVPQQREYIYH